MTKAIHDAGFSPVEEKTLLTVTGTLQKQNNGFVLVLDRMKEPRSLMCAAAQPGEAAEQELEKKVGRVVLVRGRWVAEGQGKLLIESIETNTTTEP